MITVRVLEYKNLAPFSDFSGGSLFGGCAMLFRSGLAG